MLKLSLSFAPVLICLSCTPRQVLLATQLPHSEPSSPIEVFQTLCQVFDLTWKDIMLILNETLTSNKKEATLKAAEQFGDGLHLLMPQQHRLEVSPKTKRGLLKTIQNLKRQKLLVPCNSPCNTPILGVQNQMENGV